MSEIRADKLHNVSGDNDSGIDLSTNDQVKIKTADTTRLTVASDGTVQVNDVNLDLLDTDGDVTGRFRRSAGTNSVIVEADPNNSSSSSSIQFRTDTNEAMRLDSSGRALIGATSAIAAAGGAIFQTSQSNNNWTQYVENYASSGNIYGQLIRFPGQSPDNNSSAFLACQDSGGTVRLYIWSDGDVDNHDNSYSGISDVKLKEQITDASSQWEDIKALTVRKFKFKTDVANGDSDEHWRLGVIAQEVESAGMNGLVKDSPDMIENEDGERVESGTTTKSVKYSILYMKAVKALQEAMARIETLETAKTDLEARITALENA